MTATFILRDFVLIRTGPDGQTAECPQDVYDRIIAAIADRGPDTEFTAADVAGVIGDAGPGAAEVAIAFLADRQIITPVPDRPGIYRAGPDLQADAIAAFWALDGADDGNERADLLKAAQRVLGARQDDMLTVEEWAALARAVAARTGRKTADLLTERDLEQVAEDPPLPWDNDVDGPLPDMTVV